MWNNYQLLIPFFLQTPDHMQFNAKQPFGTGPVYKTPITGYKVLADGDGVKTVYEMSIKEPPVNMNHFNSDICY